MTVEGRKQSAVQAPLMGALAAVLFLAIVIAFVAPIGNELRLILFPQDEGLLLVYPSLVLHGAVPDRSFESVYGVTNLWVIAAAFKLVGYSVAVERGVGIAYRFVILISLVGLAWRNRGPGAALVSGAICIVLLAGTLGFAAYSWICALSFAAFALLLLDIGLKTKTRRLPVVVSGVAFGLAIGARVDMAVAIFLVIVVLSVTQRKCLRWLLAGLTLGLAPMLVNILQAGLPAVVRNQIVDPIIVSGPSRRLPLSALSWQELTLLIICVGVAVASVISGVVLVRSNRSDWSSVLLLSLGVFEIGLLPEAIQRGDTLHLALVGCFVLPAAVMLPAPCSRERSLVWSLGVFPLMIGVVVLFLAEPYFGQIYWSSIWSAGEPVQLVSNDGRSVLVGSVQDQRDLTALLADLDSRAHQGQRVFVGPLDLRTANYNDTFIYFLLPRLTPGSFYLEMNPGEANGKHSRLASDLRNDDFLILTDRYDTWADPDPSTRVGPNAGNNVVKSQFRQIAQEGPWRLYDRRRFRISSTAGR